MAVFPCDLDSGALLQVHFYRLGIRRCHPFSIAEIEGPLE